MLDSQRPHNIRNIRQTCGQPVQVPHTKPGPMERLGERMLHDLMKSDAKACNSKMQGRGGWDYLENSQASIRGRQQGVKAAILDYLITESDWRDRRQICEAIGASQNASSNALYALSTEGKLEKRIIPKGSFSSGRIGQWRAKEGVE